MLAKVIIENGVKKIQALTADTGTGAPVGSLISMYKKSSPSGYLYCDGSTFDETKYPALYQYLGSNVLPDYRECVAVGAEQNTTDTIATHDIYTEGQFKDDQLQTHSHGAYIAGTGGTKWGGNAGASNDPWGGMANSAEGGRIGTVTRGKRKAVYFYIKATSGLTENQQEDVLNTINENNSYSTKEHPTGKKWIDGKPIYRKTIDCGALPNIATKQVAHNITNIEEVIVIKGNAKDTGGTRLALPFTSAYDIANSIQVTVSDTNIGIYAGSNRSSYNGYITLEYTKTTD